MKKILFTLCMALISTLSFAQTATNANGTLKFRGNVAIMVTSHYFTFENGVFQNKIEDENIKALKSALNALVIQTFGNSCFGIVNRDNEAYANVRKALEEQKLEDYINGFSIQAKGEGADCLCLTDITMYGEKNVAQMFISCRFIDIANNNGFHYSIKGSPINGNDTEGMRKEIKKLITQFRSFLTHHILDVYPEQWAIQKADGKKLYIAPYVPNGRVLPTDQFYAYKYDKTETIKAGQQSQPIQVLDFVATATGAELSSGLCLVKADKSLTPSNDIILFKETKDPKIKFNPMPFTFFALNYEPNTYDGFIKNRVNNAVYDALTRHPGSIIIEQEHLPDLKKERELQKTEDFIDGHVVDQMKAIGAQYMIHLDNFAINGSQVSFQLNMISIEQNRIIRTVDVTSSIDNIENEMYKQICARINIPVNITLNSKNSITIKSFWSLQKGSKFIVHLNKPMKNPVTNEVTYNVVQVCNCEVTKYMGNKFEAKVTDVLSQEDYNQLANYSETGAVRISIDGSDIKTDTNTESNVDKAVEKQEKKEKRKSFFNKLKEVANSVTIGIN